MFIDTAQTTGPLRNIADTLPSFLREKIGSCEALPSLEELREQGYRASLEVQAQAKQNALTAELKDRLNQSAIPERFQDASFQTFKPTTQKAAKVLRQCFEYAVAFKAMRKRGTGIVMTGNVGAGKTHLACAIANHVVAQKEVTALFVTIMALIRHFKDSRKGWDTKESDFMRLFTEPDLLVIDELGVQLGSEYERVYLFEVLNARYNARKPTILISNLLLKDLERYIGEQRVFSRFREDEALFLTFDWGDYRTKGGAV